MSSDGVLGALLASLMGFALTCSRDPDGGGARSSALRRRRVEKPHTDFAIVQSDVRRRRYVLHVRSSSVIHTEVVAGVSAGLST